MKKKNLTFTKKKKAREYIDKEQKFAPKIQKKSKEELASVERCDKCKSTDCDGTFANYADKKAIKGKNKLKDAKTKFNELHAKDENKAKDEKKASKKSRKNKRKRDNENDEEEKEREPKIS